MVKNAAFAAKPLAFYEDAQVEGARLELLKTEDPIALQDVVNTSKALVEAVKAGSLEDLQDVVANALEGEFLQVFVMQAMVLALKGASLELVKALQGFGAPLAHEQLAEALHLVCEITKRENFSDAWRILQLLVEGDGQFKVDINQPRSIDGWTPLCVACADACLPLAFKLLEFDADPNIITRGNDTPLSLVKRRRDTDNEEQKEARDIISNMLRSYGGQERWQDALTQSRRPAARRKPKGEEQVATAEDGAKSVQQAVSATHTRYSA